jgi:hypothetical protein
MNSTRVDLSIDFIQGMLTVAMLCTFSSNASNGYSPHYTSLLFPASAMVIVRFCQILTCLHDYFLK